MAVGKSKRGYFLCDKKRAILQQLFFLPKDGFDIKKLPIIHKEDWSNQENRWS